MTSVETVHTGPTSNGWTALDHSKEPLETGINGHQPELAVKGCAPAAADLAAATDVAPTVRVSYFGLFK
jgi:hypothetical protein